LSKLQMTARLCLPPQRLRSKRKRRLRPKHRSRVDLDQLHWPCSRRRRLFRVKSAVFAVDRALPVYPDIGHRQSDPAAPVRAQQRKSRLFDHLVPTGEHLSGMVIRNYGDSALNTLRLASVQHCHRNLASGAAACTAVRRNPARLGETGTHASTACSPRSPSPSGGGYRPCWAKRGSCCRR